MALEYRAPDWQTYRMDMHRPHRRLEPPEQEIALVDAAVSELADAGVLPHARYDAERFLAHRAAVAAAFDIPWTAITPRMQRLLYAINAIAQPDTMVAVGIFCGNTFISNAGAAVGPGACYQAARLIGVEIRAEEAARAARNVAALDPSGVAQIRAEDGIPLLRALDGRLDLLYLDADGSDGRGKSIYLEMLDAAEHVLRPGSLLLAHNSVNCAAQMQDYLAAVRSAGRFRQSVNVAVDGEGLEVSLYAGNGRKG